MITKLQLLNRGNKTVLKCETSEEDETNYKETEE